LLARAGWLLLTAKKYEMAEQMFREALKNRQDDCNIYRGLALSLWLNGKHDGAAKALEEALNKNFDQRYGDAKRVLREELGYILRAWQKKDPAQADAINARANKAGVRMDIHDALRATLCWETDANDVDLHVVDPNGEECFYSHARNASGLELYSDQTQGLGPEVIRTAKALTGTYHVGVNYFSAGPMGVSRGVVVVMQPKDGVVDEPQIVPFCLVPGGPDMRHLAAAKF
jgi:tetratricopeptide (TPR) repeat protein